MRRIRLGASGWSDSVAPSDGRGQAVFVYLNNDAHRYADHRYAAHWYAAHRYAAHRARPLRPMVDERC